MHDAVAEEAVRVIAEERYSRSGIVASVRGNFRVGKGEDASFAEEVVDDFEARKAGKREVEAVREMRVVELELVCEKLVERRDDGKGKSCLSHSRRVAEERAFVDRKRWERVRYVERRNAC
jgi:hypothetical protein